MVGSSVVFQLVQIIATDVKDKSKKFSGEQFSVFWLNGKVNF